MFSLVFVLLRRSTSARRLPLLVILKPPVCALLWASFLICDTKLLHFWCVFRVLPSYTEFWRRNLENFVYLCSRKPIANLKNKDMEQKARSYGRSELAQCYFPNLKTMSDWEKLKPWLSIHPRLKHLAELTRRTFTPAEVQLIFSELGEP